MIKKVISTALFSAVLAVGIADAQVVVRAAPPPMRVERRPPRPGPRYAWIDGYYRWDGRAYVWVPGYWTVPPRPRAVWVPGRWVRHRRGWVYVEGRWRW